MSRAEKLADIVYQEAENAAMAALDSGEGQDFLIQICNWTQEEVNEALKGYEDEL